jgi:UDPglucose 6-dehydrogenase
MRITVMGTGYVGLVTGTCLADLGNDVQCFDIDQAKINRILKGDIPIYEPGLNALIERNVKTGRLSFSADIKSSVAYGDIIFIAVGTPSMEDGSADTRQVLQAAKSIGELMTEFKVVVNKSTVPIGMADTVKEIINQQLDKRFAAGHTRPEFSVISNPEFLKEGSAVEDCMRPDRIVLGIENTPSGLKAKELMRKLYAPFNRNHERTFVMNVRSAELTKYAANAMLATRISFMNELANLAERVGADIDSVRQGIGSDSRIGYSFLYSGTGYGGSCFPKDVQALQYTANSHGLPLRILSAVESVNQRQKFVIAEKITAYFENDLKGLTFAVWGLAFKPNTDDMREAPSRVLIKELLSRGAHVVATDPVALQEAQHAFAEDLADHPEDLKRLSFSDNAMQILKGADALILLTEWKEYKSPNFAQIKSALKRPIIFDGRNLYDPEVMEEAGFTYEGIGRRSAHADAPKAIHGAKKTTA